MKAIKRKDTAEDAKRKFREAAMNGDTEDLYFPGPMDVYNELIKKGKFRTIKELDTDLEDVWYFNGHIYERAEEYVRTNAHALFMTMYQDMQAQIETIPRNQRNDFVQNLSGRIENALHNGPRESQINEVLAMIRRTTFTDASEMNPPGYIPFKNGLLDINKRTLSSFTPELFYTYQVDANFLDKKVTLLDTPLFHAQLNQVFYHRDIPLILTYFGYCLYPDLPIHKVLGIFGRERVGKGTLGRVLQGIITHGFGSFNLARILTADRFQFTGIEGKNVLVDFELKRKFKRGTVKDWSTFNNLFGQDVLNVEPKGREAQDRTSKAKGIVIGNLPIFSVDDAAASERWLPVVTRSKKPGRLMPNVDKEIVNKEGDQIATLLVRVLFGLIDRGWVFPGQLSSESTIELMEKLADPVENFIDEYTEPVEGAAVEVNKAYETFESWCAEKGITPIAAQTFKKNFGWTYPKKKYHRGKETGYEFLGCALTVSEDPEDEERGSEYQDHFKGGTAEKSQENRENGFRGNGYRQFQHVSLTFTRDPARKSIKDHAHKLELGDFDSKKPENKAPQEIRGSSNLQNDPVPDSQLEEPESRPNPVDSDVMVNSAEGKDQEQPGEIKTEAVNPISVEDGDMVIKQLANLGYHPDPKCGPSMDGKKYQIGVIEPSDGQRRVTLMGFMKESGFRQVKSSNLAMLAFEASIRRDQE
ncbi:MAG: hypothetical protein B2I17_10050 [Thermoplasmatales archaeon B_DKE]|nr:MAG: hypothetical protein B2I17_10050 [Thermoplasmatales archaeon B_DKE]